MTADTVAVRQNLQLIVDGGQPVPGLDDNADGAWGQTLGNRVLVWRSAVCVDANGGIIYGYGDGLGAQSLAELMQRAGCQRAMELDINPSWTTFNFYGASTAGDPSSVLGTKLLPEQHKPRQPLPHRRRPRLLRRVPPPTLIPTLTAPPRSNL